LEGIYRRIPPGETPTLFCNKDIYKIIVKKKTNEWDSKIFDSRTNFTLLAVLEPVEYYE
jgi:hypothetical protein